MSCETGARPTLARPFNLHVSVCTRVCVCARMCARVSTCVVITCVSTRTRASMHARPVNVGVCMYRRSYVHCACVHVCTCRHVCARACVPVGLCMCVCEHAHVCARMHVYMRVCVSLRDHVRGCMKESLGSWQGGSHPHCSEEVSCCPLPQAGAIIY